MDVEEYKSTVIRYLQDENAIDQELTHMAEREVQTLNELLRMKRRNAVNKMFGYKLFSLKEFREYEELSKKNKEDDDRQIQQIHVSETALLAATMIISMIAVAIALAALILKVQI